MNGNISPELDARIADMIRNSDATKKAQAISADAQKRLAKIHATVEAASQVKVPQAALDDVAQKSAACRGIATEAAERTARMSAAIEAAGQIKVNL